MTWRGPVLGPEWLRGPVVTLAAILAVELVSFALYAIDSRGILIACAVAAGAYHGGPAAGLAGAAIAVAYFLYVLAVPGHPFRYTPGSLERLILLGLATPALGLLVGGLRRRALRLREEADEQREQAGAGRATGQALREALDVRATRLLTLTRVNRTISSSLDVNEVLQEIARAAVILTDASVGRIWDADETTRLLEPRAAWDIESGLDLPFRKLRFGEGVVGWVAANKQVLAVPDVFADNRTIAREWLRARGFTSILGVPILRDGSVIAVLSLVRRRPFSVDPDHQDIVDSLVAQAAAALRNATLYSALAAGERMKDDFIGIASHQLRTPLTALRGHLELIRDGDAGPATELQARFLDVALHSADRLASLINDLLDVDRFQGRHIRFRSDRVELGLVLDDLAATLRPQALEKGLAFHLEPVATPPVLGDRDWLFQAIGNLIANAIRYTERGEVRVTLARRPGFVDVVVADTGVGIPEDEKAKLFGTFFRGAHPFVRAQAGSGLGLVIAKRIIEQHGGRISVESAPGMGSRFRLALPVENAELGPTGGKESGGDGEDPRR